LDAKGNLYGTTYAGGTAGNGTVFKIGATGKETVLHSFARAGDGINPYAGLVMDTLDNLYGTTVNGGSGGFGTVFQVDARGKETVLYSFHFSSDLDGTYPYAGLVLDTGNLFGTTLRGGARPSEGTVFRVNTSGTETVLNSFNNGEGVAPHGNLVLDGLGNLYGTALRGGVYPGYGTVFAVNPAGHETTIYKFTGSPDGKYPEGGLVRDAQGNLYGTTFNGGSGSPGLGTVFKIDTAGNETVLLRFDGKNGANPYGTLVIDTQGNLYGTTPRGGAHAAGVVFKLDTSGNETVLYNFTGKNGDGALPYAGILMDAHGNLYGTTSHGGASGFGTVFKLTLQ
jgi:uncharacterized repeat protein (TIGR03803 family)